MLDLVVANLPLVLGIAVPVVLVGAAFLSVRRSKRQEEMSAEKAEAFFKASFPELQPHLHPENVAAYVLARRGKQFAKRTEWSKPAGFASAALARYQDAPKGELTVLLDAAGRRILEFVLEPKSGAVGALRVGQGKFTVRQDPGQPPRVSYWHPDREFSWKGRGRWKFTSRLADEPIDTTDRNWSRSTSDSSWSPTTTAAAAAGVVGLGGSFDGGGASGGWDADGKDGSSSSGDGGSGDASSGGGASSDDSSSSTSY
jgi:uncharacterized membrane protein YgcG